MEAPTYGISSHLLRTHRSDLGAWINLRDIVVYHSHLHLTSLISSCCIAGIPSITDRHMTHFKWLYIKRPISYARFSMFPFYSPL